MTDFVTLRILHRNSQRQQTLEKLRVLLFQMRLVFPWLVLDTLQAIQASPSWLIAFGLKSRAASMIPNSAMSVT
jgi:hypothetical protein